MASTYKKKRIPDGERRRVAIKYGLVCGDRKEIPCHYCGSIGIAHWFEGRSWVAFQDLEMDHVFPESLGGLGVAENIVLACRACNRSKGTKI
jgi:5-methylcytosine-specific restriction endonuclease McrA